MQNAFVESFLGRFCGEFLNETLLSSLDTGRQAINEWNENYNHYRPHSAIGNVPQAEYAMKSMLENKSHKAKNEAQDSELCWKKIGSQVKCQTTPLRRIQAHAIVTQNATPGAPRVRTPAEHQS